MNRGTDMPEAGESVDVPVWDLPVRLFHWALFATVTVSWVSGKAGRLDVHYVSGLIVLGLVTFRLLWGLVGSPTARFSHFVRGPLAALAYLRRALASRTPSYSVGHNPAGGLMVVVLLAAIGFQAFSGLGNTDDVLFDGPLRDDLPEWMVAWMSRLHRPISSLILVLVGLHVAAIIAYGLAKRENLVRAMIIGRATLPAAIARDASASGQTQAAPVSRAVICAVAAALVPAAIHWLN